MLHTRNSRSYFPLSVVEPFPNLPAKRDRTEGNGYPFKNDAYAVSGAWVSVGPVLYRIPYVHNHDENKGEWPEVNDKQS